ncbi:hypothetical protein CHUAL_007755 [Chamberlinius hualienensis]
MATKFIVQLSLKCCLVYALLIVLNNGSNVKASVINSSGSTTTRCNRHPTDTSSPKTSGDNGYKIQIVGNPEKYVPGESYTVKLNGFKTPVSVQKFNGFTLVVEPKIETQNSQDIGKFEILGDVFTKFSDNCPNAVTETSSMVKDEIQVVWVAPKVRSGCVVFKATVVEYKDKWLMDDGGLTKELCPEEENNDGGENEVVNECCACDDAKYEVTFQGLWSRNTHPKNFPQNSWLTHFSEIIGASHSPEYTMWANGMDASEGLETVAETGITGVMEGEMKQQSHYIRTIIKARGLIYPNLNGSTYAVFRVDKKHHLMSLVSMIGPSPDWVTGVSRVELCLKNCSWVTHRSIDLYPWDAGTDSGILYTSLDEPTSPKDQIRRITTTYPSNPESPFFDPSGEPMKPVAKLTLIRQRLYEKSCDGSSTDSNEDVTTESTIWPFSIDDTRMQCRVSDWSAYTPCSSTCGEGMRMRSRYYLDSMKAQMFSCATELVQKAKCVSEVDCQAIACAVTQWSPWGKCSVTCGKGTRTRRRNYKNVTGVKQCLLNLMEKEPCMANIHFCEHQEDPLCETTQWSEWSPCMTTCGTGMKLRTRIYLKPVAQGICTINLKEEANCTAERASCILGIEEASEICTQPKVVGPCRGHFSRWYFDTVKRTCLQFSYGGCRGNQNNFKHYEECKQLCDVVKLDLRQQVPLDSPTLATYSLLHNANAGQPVDCQWKWAQWSPCSASCGLGHKTRHKIIKVHPQNGGKECPRRTGAQRRQCNKPCQSEEIPKF